MLIKKICCVLLVGVFQSEARQNISYLRGNQTLKMQDSYLGMLHNDPYSGYKYCGSQVYVPAASPGPSPVQFVHPYANRPNPHPYANRPNPHPYANRPNPHPYANRPSQPSTCTSYITIDQVESSQVEDSRADESGKRGKGPKKQAAKCDSLEEE